MADDNNRNQTLFRPVRTRPIPRPTAWRVLLVQGVAAVVLIASAGIWYPEVVVAVLVAALLALVAQLYFTWRSLRHYGARHTGLFLLGSTQGLFGKWIMVAFGLVLLWRDASQPEALAMLLTVIVINTLAAALAPILVK